LQIQLQEKQYEEGSNCLGCADRLNRQHWLNRLIQKFADVLAANSFSK
jgi:hypothetical protein